MDVKPLSNNEITEKLAKYGVNVRFIPYHILQYIEDIDQILPCILLYEHHFPIGHWVAIFKNSDGMNYFDSTGRVPDDLLVNNFDNPKGRGVMGADFTHLLRLFKNTGQKLIYNEVPLQTPGTNTCGYFSGVRLLTQNLTNDQFNDCWKGISGKERQRKIVALWNEL